jgi:hypothetical protein
MQAQFFQQSGSFGTNTFEVHNGKISEGGPAQIQSGPQTVMCRIITENQHDLLGIAWTSIKMVFFRVDHFLQFGTNHRPQVTMRTEPRHREITLLLGI